MSIKRGANGLPVGSGLYWKRDKIYAAIRVDGKKHVYNTGTDKVREAVEFKDEKSADLRKNAKALGARGIRVQDLFDDYISHLKRREHGRGAYMSHKHSTPSYKAQSMINRHLVPVFSNLKPDQITTDRLNKYRADRIEAKASVVTVNRELSCLRTSLRLGSHTTPRKVNPLTIPSRWPIDIEAEKRAKRTGLIDPEQYERVMQVAPDYLKPIFATVCETGIRSKEITFIRPEQVQFEKHRIELRAGETKKGDPRIVPISDNLEEILQAWKLKTELEYPKAEWFFHQDGKQIKSWKHQWNRTLKLAGLRVKLENGKWKNLVLFHDTRRTAITKMDEAGVRQEDRMKTSGHTGKDMDINYNQSQQALERVRHALNTANGSKTAVAVPAAPVVSNTPVAGNGWMAKLQELKTAHDAGLLPHDIYTSEVAKVMASR
jgi:integrase